MKKKMFAAAVCVAMSVALCACSKTNPTGTENLTGTPTGEVTLTPQATATPSPLELMYQNLPVTDYDEYVESTVLPEGYIGFEIDEITDADVEGFVQETLESHKERVLKDGAIEEGDIAIISYTGYINGATFEDGTSANSEVEVGAGEYIDGFEEGLIGAKKGDSLMLNLKFPEDYGDADLNGKDVMFEIKILSTAAQVLPEFTDEFVTEVTSGKYTTTEDYRLYARGFLQEERRYNGIMDYLVKNAVFNKMNEDYIQAAFELEKEYYAQMYGTESVEALEEALGEASADFLWTVVEQQIRRYEQDRIVLYCVAKAENLELTEEEFIERVTEYAESIGMTYADIMKAEDEKSLRQSMLMELAMEHLLENVVVVEEGAEE